MNILGIESSCDETSVSILADGIIKSNLIASQDFHVKFGGVVPELSSRAHLQIINPLLKQSLEEAKLSLDEIDIICATAGPGLIGAVLVGFTFAKGLAFSLKKEFIPVNHIEGHIFSGFLMDEKPRFPFLGLVVSGGHTLLLLVKSETEIIKLGTTIDDAAGEAFDKVAKMVGLGYPGGPNIQKAALKGDADIINFPVPRCKNEFDFSFSGLKTSVLRYVQKVTKDSDLDEATKNNIAAGFQKTAVKSLTVRVKKALLQHDVKSLSLVGGVAANQALRTAITEIGNENNLKVVIPDISFCGDNAAMIAMRGLQIHNAGYKFGLDCNAFPSMPKDAFKSL